MKYQMSDVEVKDSGKLEEKPPLPRMLEMLNNAFKGVMIFVRGKERKSFVFDEGKPLIPTVNLKEAILGRSLFEKNIINVEQFNKIKQIESTGKSFFESAIEGGDKEKILEFVLATWKLDLETIALWDVGQFASVEMIPKDMTKITLPKSINHYIFNALVIKNQKKKPKFSSYARFEIDANPDTNIHVDDLQLNERQNLIYTSLKSSKTTKMVAQEVKKLDNEVSPIIYALRDIGIVRADSDVKRKVVVQPATTATVANTQKPKVHEVTNAEKSEFQDKFSRLDELDHFEILGVEKNVGQKEIQDKYFALAKKYHPDRLKSTSAIHLKDAEKFFTKITEAYNTLSNAVLRKEYEMKISQDAVDHENLLEKILESEKIFSEGTSLLNKNLFKEAAGKFYQAIQLYDQEPEYYIKMGWALFRQGVKEATPGKISEGKKLLQDAFAKGYHMADVSYYLGMIFKQENKLDQAIKYFRSCINEDPHYALALSELRLLEKKSDTKVGKKK